MTERLPTGLSESDVVFLVETIEPRLLSRVDTVKGDTTIIDAMLDQHVEKLFNRMMGAGEPAAVSGITPRFMFEVLLRMAVRELQSHSYTLERTATQRIPVFDSGKVVLLLSDKAIVTYLADMLSSFTRNESFTLSVRVKKGVWRKVRFSDLDLDSLIRVCESLNEDQRFVFYKRIADLCLFVLGMFPENVASGLVTLEDRKNFSTRSRSAEDYEDEGRHFYKLAGGHKDAKDKALADVLWRLHENFSLAKKPLNYISENFVQLHKWKLFRGLSSN